MLCDKLFDQEWRVLCKIFKREPDKTVYERYYATLAEELTDIQFQAICQSLLKVSVRFPTIAEFLALKPPQSINHYELPHGAIDLRAPYNHDPIVWAKATLALPNHPRWGNLKRRAQAILEANNVAI
jgi:hypothetical protein